MRIIKNKIITTKDNLNYWKERKIDWKESYFKPDHPHRKYIIETLRPIANQTVNLLEIGCGAGANLFRIHQAFPRITLGGCDINVDAIMAAKDVLPKGSMLSEMKAHDLYLSSQSVDVILTDACLMYTGFLNIKKVLKEIKRVCRGYVIFCEPMTSNSIIKFLAWRRSGYFLHNYVKLLKKLDFYDIQILKLPLGSWEDTGWERYGYVIKAHV